MFVAGDVPPELGTFGVWAMWVAKNGAPITDRYLLAANTPRRSDVASDGDTFAFTLGNHLALLRPDWYYAVPLPLGAHALDSRERPVASNGDGFLVAWSLFDSPRGTFVARVDRDGVLTATRKVSDDYSEYLALTSDGEGYLLVSSLNDQTTKGNDLKAQRLDGRGNPIGGRIDVINAVGHQSLPAVTWDGVQYVVTWVVAGGVSGPLEIGRIKRDGTVLDGLPGAGMRLADMARHPVIDVDPLGRTIISYEAPIESPYESVWRVHYVLIDTLPFRGRGVRRR